jgi:pimeloyl-ACP methyl ester carboxylesterase
LTPPESSSSRPRATTRPSTPPRQPSTSIHSRDFRADLSVRRTDEFAFLSRPGVADIQIDLFYDYRTNVTNYLAWSAWLRLNQPPTLVIWGWYDPSFLVAETAAYQRDLPGAEVHILDAGHFALYEKPDEIAKLVGDFLGRTLSQPADLEQ